MVLSINEWKEKNPGKSIHQYYSEYLPSLDETPDLNPSQEITPQTPSSSTTDNKATVDIIRNLVKDGKIKEAFDAFISCLEEENYDNKEVINAKSQLQQQEKLFLLGVLSDDEFSKVSVKLTSYILDVLSLFEKGIFDQTSSLSQSFLDKNAVNNRINIKIQTLQEQWKQRSFIDKLTAPATHQVVYYYAIFSTVIAFLVLLVISSVSSSFSTGFGDGINSDFPELSREFDNTVKTGIGAFSFLTIFLSSIYLVGLIYVSKWLKKKVKQNREVKRQIDEQVKQLVDQLV